MSSQKFERIGDNILAVALKLIGKPLGAPVANTLYAGSGKLVLLATASASGDATIDFTTGIDDRFDVYKIFGAAVVPATDGVNLYFRVSEDAGSTWEADAADYGWGLFSISETGTGHLGDASDSEIQMNLNTIGSAAGECLGFEITIYHPANTSLHTLITWKMVMISAAGALNTINGAGRYLSTTAVNGFRTLFSSDAVESGEFALYGVEKV